jgi:hypothetical protein
MNEYSSLENALRILNRWKASSASILSFFSSSACNWRSVGIVASIEGTQVSLVGPDSWLKFNLQDSLVTEQSPSEAPDELQGLATLEFVSALRIVSPTGEVLFLYEVRKLEGSVM